LKIFTESEFDEMTSKNIDILIQLRNSIIHFKPATIGRLVDGKCIEKDTHMSKLIKEKADMNPFAINRDTHFPNLYLSYSLTRWAIKSSLLFLKEFFEKLNIDVDDWITESVCNKMKRELNIDYLEAVITIEKQQQ